MKSISTGYLLKSHANNDIYCRHDFERTSRTFLMSVGSGQVYYLGDRYRWTRQRVSRIHATRFPSNHRSGTVNFSSILQSRAYLAGMVRLLFFRWHAACKLYSQVQYDQKLLRGSNLGRTGGFTVDIPPGRYEHATHEATRVIVLNARNVLACVSSGVMTRVYFGKMVPCPICQGRGAPAEEMRPCKMCRYALWYNLRFPVKLYAILTLFNISHPVRDR